MSQTRPKRWISAAIIITGCLLAIYGKSLMGGAVKFSFDSYVVRAVYTYGWWLIPVIGITGLMFGFRNLFSNLGLSRGFFIGVGFAVITVFPMFAGSALLGEFSGNIVWAELLRKTILAAFMEEILFRGFVFGLLFNKLKWGFIPASLPGAVIFSVAHLYQGSGFAESTGIFLVTFIGSLWFAWLYTEWNNNLWVPIWLHALMNLSWALFYPVHTALGDMGSNVFRMITIVLTVIITVVNCRKRKLFKLNGTNLFINFSTP